MRPPDLVGRDAERQAFDVIIGRVAHGNQSAPMFLTGLRGVGKTVLLETMHADAEQAGWLAIGLEATAQRESHDRSAQQLARGLTAVARKLKAGKQPGRFAAALHAIDTFSLNVGVTGVAVSVGKANQPSNASSDIGLDLLDVVEAIGPVLAEDRKGLAVFVDEMQMLPAPTIGALLSAQHRASQRDWPFYAIGAGLPNLPTVLADARSYAERFDYWRIGTLSDEDARTALAEPAAREGAAFDEDALEVLVHESVGYPYFLQTFGYYAWDLGQAGRVDITAAREAITRGYDRLDRGFFATRWDRATPLEQQYLGAMAQDAPFPTDTSAIPDRLDRTPTQLTSTRASLLRKGLIYAPARGQIAFTLPGLPAFIARNRA
jgi:hypothetical protein